MQRIMGNREGFGSHKLEVCVNEVVSEQKDFYGLRLTSSRAVKG